jgi:tRNA pseudouridine55 synthase
MTSHDVVNVARKLFRTKRVGHTGTLDPDATGVLVLCIGQATRLAEYLSASRKHYVAEVVFGVETDTQDASGQVTAEQDASHLTQETLLALLPRFRGTIQQVPPMVSAVHHQGRRLYELAREGVTVERVARDVQIDELELTDFRPGAHPVATLEITCSTGTYIRTLAADLGTAAQTGGMMQSLRRTWVGEPGSAFTLEDAHTLEELREKAANDTLNQALLPLITALRRWPQAHLTDAQAARVRHGQFLAVSEFRSEALSHWPPATSETPVALISPDSAVCAVAYLVEYRLRPVKVFADDQN